MLIKKTILLLLASAAFWGCSFSGRTAMGDMEVVYTPEYARGFEILSLDGNPVLKIENPWQGARGVDQYVFISRDGSRPPAGFEGAVIAAPVGKVACMSSSHVAFLDAIGSADVIRAVSGLRYLNNGTVLEAARNGKCYDVGYEGNIDYEKLAMLRPDVLFMYSVSGEKLPVIDKMRELSVPVVMIGDYLESSPLGKAEWIVAFGEIMGRREKAEELFREVCFDYRAAAEVASASVRRPGVMLNAPWRDTWFVPGDDSYMVRLINDAGGRYVCEGVASEQSRAINGETAFLYASTADIWLNTNNISSIAELTGMNPNFADLPVIVNRRVWNNNLRSTPGGGSDFWESGCVYPNVVLKDLIRIIHPDMLPDHELVYYKQVE